MLWNQGPRRKGISHAATFADLLPEIHYADAAIPVTKDEECRRWVANITVSTKHPAVRRCDVIDIFGVAGKIGLIAWGPFRITVARSKSRLPAWQQTALLSSSANLDPRTDLGIHDMKVYNEAADRPYFDFDGYMEGSVLPGGGETKVKLLTPGEDRHASIANR